MKPYKALQHLCKAAKVPEDSYNFLCYSSEAQFQELWSLDPKPYLNPEEPTILRTYIRKS